MKCERCGQETRMQVQAVLAAPSELLHKFSKSNLRRADVYLMGVLWETADFICTNFECRTVTDGYGNYVSRLKKDHDALRKELKVAREWIAARGQGKDIDYACAQCVPNAARETLIEGFVCAYHAAIKEGS